MSEIEQLKAQIVQKDEQFNRLRNQAKVKIQKLTQDLEAAQNKATSSETSNEQIENLKNFEKELADKNSLIERLKIESQNINAETQLRLQELERQLLLQQQVNKNLENEVKEKDQQNAQLQEMSTGNVNLHEKQEQLQQELQEQKQQIDEKNNANLTLQKSLQDAESKLHIVEQNINQLNEENRKLKHDFDIINTQNLGEENSHQEKIAELVKELEKRKSENMELQGTIQKISDGQHQLQEQLNQQIGKIRDELEGKDKELEELKSNANDGNPELELKLKQLTDENDEKAGRLTGFQMIQDRQKKKLEEQNYKIEQMQREIENKDSDIEQFKEEMFELKIKANKGNDEAEQKLKQDIESLKTQLQQQENGKQQELELLQVDLKTKVAQIESLQVELSNNNNNTNNNDDEKQKLNQVEIFKNQLQQQESNKNQEIQQLQAIIDSKIAENDKLHSDLNSVTSNNHTDDLQAKENLVFLETKMQQIEQAYEELQKTNEENEFNLSYVQTEKQKLIQRVTILEQQQQQQDRDKNSGDGNDTDGNGGGNSEEMMKLQIQIESLTQRNHQLVTSQNTNEASEQGLRSKISEQESKIDSLERELRIFTTSNMDSMDIEGQTFSFPKEPNVKNVMQYLHRRGISKENLCRGDLKTIGVIYITVIHFLLLISFYKT